MDALICEVALVFFEDWVVRRSLVFLGVLNVCVLVFGSLVIRLLESEDVDGVSRETEVRGNWETFDMSSVRIEERCLPVMFSPELWPSEI